MNTENVLIRFDWAAKRILRQKANFGVLEGLVTVLLGFPIHIESFFENENNEDPFDSNTHRVDFKATTDDGESIIIAIQILRENSFLLRKKYGWDKTVPDRLPYDYTTVEHIYSIVLVYFDFCEHSGRIFDDYVYKGHTILKGLHSGSKFNITDQEQDAFGLRLAVNAPTTNYVVLVNHFEKRGSSHLEQWLEYLKYGVIGENPPNQSPARTSEVLHYSSAQLN